jgi:antitoxin component YwqK of YwqJK toxin-antitoxin module
MEKKNGQWHLIDSANPYSGKFIDYYYNGREQRKGEFREGRANGRYTTYFHTGIISVERHYLDGIPDGTEKEYYPDGSLMQKGDFKAGKEEGVWEMYYPNGQVKQHNIFSNGQFIGESLTYYSTGKVKAREKIKNGKNIPDPSRQKIDKLYNNGTEATKVEDYKTAIKYFQKCIDLDSTYAEAWFGKGTAELDNAQFDIALSDFDKAISLEPYFMNALSNRAVCRIRKYQYASSRIISKNSEVTVLAARDKVPVPDNEKVKICSDLEKAILLGDKLSMIKEAVKEYCIEKGK